MTFNETDKVFFEYCCKDSCVTYEINSYLEPRVKETARQQYLFNIGLLLPFRYMELRGIRYDHVTAKARAGVLKAKMHIAQARLNGLTGFGFTWKSCAEIVKRAKEVCLTKKEDRERKAKVEDWTRFQHLWGGDLSGVTMEKIGEIEDICEVSLNVGSDTQLQPFLYQTLKLPEQWSDKRGKAPTLTCDYEALLNLSKYCLQKNLTHEHEIIQAIIELRGLSTRCTNLSCNYDKDSRMRFGYNIVGSNTGRTQCYLSPTGRGRAGQGIPKYTIVEEAPGGVIGDRDLFVADPGNFIFECDLEGADSWTVAAYCAMLGDATMLTDLQIGIRPAKRICLKLRGVKIDYSDPQSVLEASKAVSKSSWDYFASKRVVHGGSYLEGARTICRNILKDSEGKLYWSEREGQQAKDLLLKECYPGIVRYHQYIGRKLSQRPVLIAASGQVRQFFGRPDEILTKAVAFEPQANTTFCTNKALWRLWSDYENRMSNMSNTLQESSSHKIVSWENRPESRNALQSNTSMRLRIEPLHQVHDALLGQFPTTDVVWAVNKIKSYFNNPITIAGITLTIPFEGGYGTSWGNLKAGEIKP